MCTGLTESDNVLDAKTAGCLINIDASASFLGQQKRHNYVWMTDQGAAAAKEKQLSIGATKAAAKKAHVQKRAIKYLAVVSAAGTLLAHVTYIKDRNFPKRQSKLVRLGTTAGTGHVHYAFFNGVGRGVEQVAANIMIRDIIAPIMQQQSQLSRQPLAAAAVVVASEQAPRAAALPVSDDDSAAEGGEGDVEPEDFTTAMNLPDLDDMFADAMQDQDGAQLDGVVHEHAHADTSITRSWWRAGVRQLSRPRRGCWVWWPRWRRRRPR